MRWTSRLGLILVLLLSAFAPAHPENPLKLRVVLDQDYPPFFYRNEQGEPAGVSVDFWKLWEEKTGISVELIPLPWERAHEVIKAREAEVIDTIFWTPEREAYLDFAGPLFPMTSSIYVRRGIPVSSLADLTPYVVGAKSRDALVDYAKSQNPAIHFRLFPNYSDIVLAAKRREIDCFLMDDLPAHYYLVKYNLLSSFSRVPLPILNHIYLATWKGNEEVLAILREGLSKFSKDEIEALLRPYVVELKAYPPWLRKVAVSLALGVAAFIGVLFALNRLLKKRIALATRELLARTQALEETERKLFKTIEVVATLPLFSVREEEFLAEILDLAFKLIPKAQAGSVILIDEQGRYRIIAVRGYSEDLLGFTFEREEFIAPAKTQVVQDILNPRRRPLLKERLEWLASHAKPIAETLLAPLHWKEKLLGYLALDIFQESGERFEESDVFLAERFAQICVAFHALQEYAKREESLLEGLLLALAQALEYYDGSTRVHSEASAEYALAMARALGLSEERVRLVRLAALVHDVGKIFIPQEILRKPGKLTPEEYDLVKLHTAKGEELLSRIRDLEPIARIVRHHHERFDGTGYPDGLWGEEIPLESRILAVVDAFEAMTSDRPYRKAMTVDEALEELRRFSGTQFDPQVVNVMVALMEKAMQSAQEKE